MVKEKRILSYFLGWLIIGFVICFIGVNKIFAETTTEYENLGYLTDYTLYYVQADYSNLLLEIQKENAYQLEQVTAFILDVENYTFNPGVTYNIEISMPLNTLTNANRYEVKDENGNLCSVTQIDNSVQNYPNFTFNCPNSTRRISLKIYNSNNDYIVNTGLFRWNYTYLRKQIISQNLGVIENQQSQIIDQNNQIIQGQDNIKDAIIDSNKETQEVIKDQFKSCRPSNNLININEVSLSMSNRTYEYLLPETLLPGTYTLSYNFLSNNSLSKRFQIWLSSDNSNIKYFNLSDNGYITFTIDNSFDKIMFFISSNADSNSNFSINKIMLQKGSVFTDYEPYGEEICSNKIDQTNNTLNNIGDKLTDSSPTDMSGLGDSAGWLPAGPVDSIINLPLTFFLNLSQSLSSECRPVSLPLPYVNKNIELPCMYSIYEKIGITGIGGFLTWVGLICSAVILFNYLLDLYHWVDKTLTMRENTMPGYYEDKWGGGA